MLHLTYSTALDPKVISQSLSDDGNDPPVDGQSASITSTNNFINFCLTSNLPLTDGKQVQDGSCNPVPMGAIPAKSKMPATKFVSPKNLDTINANEKFTIKMSIKNLQTGTFVNADTKYFAAPQQLNDQGLIIGHSVRLRLSSCYANDAHIHFFLLARRNRRTIEFGLYRRHGPDQVFFLQGSECGGTEWPTVRGCR